MSNWLTKKQRRLQEQNPRLRLSEIRKDAEKLAKKLAHG